MIPEIDLLRKKLATHQAKDLRDLFEATLARLEVSPVIKTFGDKPYISVDETRHTIFATEDRGQDFNIELWPPAPLIAFLTGADASELADEEIVNIEALVVDWMNRHYPPPAHLGYYLDHAVESADPVPLELWLTWRRNCDRAHYPQ